MPPKKVLKEAAAPPPPPQKLWQRHCVHAETGELTPDPRFEEDVDLSARGQQEPYDRHVAARLKEVNQHFGQRKLLLSEVQMLTEYYGGGFDEKKKKKAAAKKPKKHPVLVYVGSAPGTHLLFLRRLFPGVKFVLYDGAPFDPALAKDRAGFELHNEYFVDATCTELQRRWSSDAAEQRRPVLFVCDIRSDAAGNDERLFESQVMRDMISQKRWLHLLDPEMSLLKFRLPYTLRDGDRVPYLRGRLRFGIWPPGESGETRLLVSRADAAAGDIEWDYGAYERAAFYHNRVVRRTCFSSKVAPVHAKFVFGRDNLYCSCFDCLAELGTYQRYIDGAQQLARDVAPPPPPALVPYPAPVPPTVARVTRAPPVPTFVPWTMDDVVRAYAEHATGGRAQFPVSAKGRSGVVKRSRSTRKTVGAVAPMVHQGEKRRSSARKITSESKRTSQRR